MKANSAASTRPTGQGNQGKRIRQGTGRFAGLSFGYGDPNANVTRVLGASMKSIEWNRPAHIHEAGEPQPEVNELNPSNPAK